MNVQITLDNLKLLIKRFEGKELKPAQEAAKTFISDGCKTIQALGNLVIEREQTIANDFRLNTIKAIEYRLKDKQILDLNNKLLSLQEEIKQLRDVNTNLMNEI